MSSAIADTIGQPAPSDMAIITEAVLSAASNLKVNDRELAEILGVSKSTVSRVRSGTVLPGTAKVEELAIIFIRLYRSLDAIVGGDDQAAQQWLRNQNYYFDDAPIKLLFSCAGLISVVDYLDSYRALS